MEIDIHSSFAKVASIIKCNAMNELKEIKNMNDLLVNANMGKETKC